ncbi:Postreplication repair E3 ubiquitin-protein ligase rad18 [Mycena venus]|uniref:Postreplication repair E3 ubiquitin-protein ligase RAD18 n=1 Tax=Mycena venus TaxID=2733690 RepID=A0A8H6Y8S9_9AGAR|nr:Postreplication repair E3 ubiquitin-protein ligase rad18 [Mycena venus]
MNSSKLSTLLALDLEDPTDFPKKASSLRDLDTAVRCPICSDYFNGPVSLLCGHCFCSMCIRGVISDPSSKSQCPTCRQNMTESQLRPNPGIEDVVAAWRFARPYILSLAKQEEEPVTAEPAKKKRKLDPSCVAGPSRTSSTESKSDLEILSSAAPQDDVPKPDTIVDCPLCKQSMKYKELNRHMDNNCATVSPRPLAPTSKSQKTLWSDIMQPKSKGKEKDRGSSDEDHLPKTAYDTLKDRQLKDKLVDLGLPTTGDRTLWIARHQRWTIQWNANLDKSAPNRQSKAELLKELKKWEEERKVKRKKATVDESYLKTHNSDFKKLVDAARPKSKGSVAAGTNKLDVVPASSPASSAVPLNSESDIIVVDSDGEKDDL